jgi:hypothetical protein
MPQLGPAVISKKALHKSVDDQSMSQVANSSTVIALFDRLGQQLR